MLSSMTVQALFSHLHSKVDILFIVSGRFYLPNIMQLETEGAVDSTPSLSDSRDCVSNHYAKPPPALKVVNCLTKW